MPRTMFLNAAPAARQMADRCCCARGLVRVGAVPTSAQTPQAAVEKGAAGQADAGNLAAR